MTWYAIQTKPGAQMPQREYAAETTQSRKGYRIVPSLNPTVSAIERTLTDAGFVCYMPVEKRLIRDRRKPDLWKTRRFALLLGYVFIKGPCNFLRLQELPGVGGIVGTCGKPMPVDIVDILMLRTAEAKSEAEFDRQNINAQRAIRRKARNRGDKKLTALVNSLDVTGITTVEIGQELLVA
jgi:transcription antitermination factor NusG